VSGGSELSILDVPLDSGPPGPVRTEEDDPATPDTPLQGPPGSATFSLAGRPAAGLYLVAWLFALGGAAILFMTILASAEGISPAHAIQPILIGLAVVLLGLGFATGAGYQVVARQTLRPAETYRGPSPVLSFGIVLVLGTALSFLLVLVGLDPAGGSALAFLLNLVAVAACYVVVVWLFVVRTGSLSWRQMGWPVGKPIPAILADVAYGAAVTIVAMVAIGIVALVVSALLGGVEAPDILPTWQSPMDLALIALGTVVIAPIGEELFFRGFSLSAWWLDLGPRSALIRSAVFFGFVHILSITADDFGTGVRQVGLVLAQIIPLAFVLGWLFIRRGIAASIAGHVAYNAIVLAVALSAHSL
jgi:membrane protease YdiL (CAAX protease family)